MPVNRLLKDLSIDRVQNPANALNDRWDSEEEDADDGDVDIIDHCHGKRGLFDDNFFFSCSLLFVFINRKKRACRFLNCRCYSGSSARNGGYKLANA
jgi:hypothetical protein